MDSHQTFPAIIVLVAASHFPRTSLVLPASELILVFASIGDRDSLISSWPAEPWLPR